MAIGGRATLKLEFRDFNRELSVVMTKVGRATKKATIAACEEILAQSLKEVPKDSSTLASSAYYEIQGDYRTGFSGVVAYGGKGNPINPKTGQRASEYMLVVHEDLSARHPIGKAKFLEDPVRDYQRRLNPRFSHFIKQELGL